MRRLTWIVMALGAACGSGGQGGIVGPGGPGGAAGTGIAGFAGGAGSTAGGGGAGAGGSAGTGGTAGAGADAGAACPTPDPLPDGGFVPCGSSSLCDPPYAEGVSCQNVPSTNAAWLSFTIWVEDAAAPDGGWRVTLNGPTAVSAGGHSYQDLQEGLVGSGGNGIFGDLFVARDGEAKWTGFHLEGWPTFHGGGVWDWPATITVSRVGASAPATVSRHYRISRDAPACPGTTSAVYTFAADEPPRACAFGIDLVSITFPGR